MQLFLRDDLADEVERGIGRIGVGRDEYGFALLTGLALGVEAHADGPFPARRDGLLGPLGYCAAARRGSIANQERDTAGVGKRKGMVYHFSAFHFPKGVGKLGEL